MISTKFKWLLADLLSVGLLCTPLWSGPVHAQGSDWNSHFDAGVEAYLEKDYAEAGKRFLSAIAVAERLGADEPRLATSLNALGEVYLKQGKYAAAEEAHGRALKIREKILKPNHPDIIQSLTNLARVYQAGGKVAQAQALQKRGRESKAQTAPPERRQSTSKSSPSRPREGTQQTTWEQLMRAGSTAYEQGKYVEAEKQWIVGLKVSESFGDQDPRYATNLNDLAELYRTQGRYAEAEPLYKRALAIREEVFGVEHPAAAMILNNLALA